MDLIRILLSHHPDCNSHFKGSTITIHGTRFCKGCTLMYGLCSLLITIYALMPWKNSFLLFITSCALYLYFVLKKMNYIWLYGFMLAFALIDLFENLYTNSFFSRFVLFLLLLLVMIFMKYRSIKDKVGTCSSCALSFR